jgi:hypothetical protein
MAIFAVTFRIHDDDTYQERWLSAVSAIRNETVSEYWEEPTSFALIESDKTSEAVADSINNNSKLAPSKDLLVVINISVTKGHKAVGVIDDNDFRKLMAKRSS